MAAYTEPMLRLRVVPPGRIRVRSVRGYELTNGELTYAPAPKRRTLGLMISAALCVCMLCVGFRCVMRQEMYRGGRVRGGRCLLSHA